MSVGLNINQKTKDFSIANGKLVFVDSKPRTIRNFEKALITKSGNLTQLQDLRTRYNALFGLDYSKMYGQSKSLQESMLKVKTEVERVCSRFVNAQKIAIEYSDSTEVIGKYEVSVAAGDYPAIYFNVVLWSVEDLQLGNSPSYSKTFSTEPVEFHKE